MMEEMPPYPISWYQLWPLKIFRFRDNLPCPARKTSERRVLFTVGIYYIITALSVIIGVQTFSNARGLVVTLEIFKNIVHQWIPAIIILISVITLRYWCCTLNLGTVNYEIITLLNHMIFRGHDQRGHLEFCLIIWFEDVVDTCPGCTLRTTAIA